MTLSATKHHRQTSSWAGAREMENDTVCMVESDGANVMGLRNIFLSVIQFSHVLIETTMSLIMLQVRATEC